MVLVGATKTVPFVPFAKLKMSSSLISKCKSPGSVVVPTKSMCLFAASVDDVIGVVVGAVVLGVVVGAVGVVVGAVGLVVGAVVLGVLGKLGVETFNLDRVVSKASMLSCNVPHSHLQDVAANRVSFNFLVN